MTWFIGIAIMLPVRIPNGIKILTKYPTCSLSLNSTFEGALMQH